MKSIKLVELAKLLTAWVAARRTQVEGWTPSRKHYKKIQKGIAKIQLAEEALVKWVDENLLDDSE